MKLNFPKKRQMTSPIAKSTSPGLLDTTFFASCKELPTLHENIGLTPPQTSTVWRQNMSSFQPIRTCFFIMWLHAYLQPTVFSLGLVLTMSLLSESLAQATSKGLILYFWVAPSSCLKMRLRAKLLVGKWFLILM